MSGENGSVSNPVNEDISLYSVEELTKLLHSQQQDIKNLKAAAAKKSEQDALQAVEDHCENNLAQMRGLLHDTFGGTAPTLHFSKEKGDEDAEDQSEEDPYTVSLAQTLAAENSGVDADQVTDDIPEPICTAITQKIVTLSNMLRLIQR